jgi:hypothetical protein
MQVHNTELVGARAPLSGAALPPRAWPRIVLVSATVSVLVGGLGSAAAQAFAAQSLPSHQEQITYDRAGCQELLAFPKYGWVCVR